MRTAPTTHTWLPTTAVLALIRESEGITRAQLIELTGFSRATVAARLSELRTRGLVSEQSSRLSTGGRPPTLLTFNAKAGVVLAAEAGISRVTLAVADLSGEIIATRTHRDSLATDPSATIDGWCESLEDLLVGTGHEVDDVRAVGISLPGPVDHVSGQPLNGFLTPGWLGFPVAQAVQRRFRSGVVVDSDVNTIALGESRRNAGHDSLVAVKASMSVGLGHVVKGLVQHGIKGVAGDIGHLRVPGYEEVGCQCGRSGCVEAVAGGAALIQRLAAAGHVCASTAEVAQHARDGLPEAIAAVIDAGRAIGMILATVVNVLNPSRVVVAGELAHARDHLLHVIRETVYREANPLATVDLEIASSSAGDHAGMLGTVTMAVEEVLRTACVEVAGAFRSSA